MALKALGYIITAIVVCLLFAPAVALGYLLAKVIP